MYIHNENILDYIENNIDDSVTSIKDMLLLIYNNLLLNNVIKQKDIYILNKWNKYF